MKYWCPSQYRVPATSLTSAESNLGFLFPVRGGEDQAVAQEPSEQPNSRHSRPCQKVSGLVAIEDDGEGEDRRGKMRKERQKISGESFLRGKEMIAFPKMVLLWRRE